MSKQPTDFSTDYERAAYAMFSQSGNPYLGYEFVKERNEMRANKEIERER